MNNGKNNTNNAKANMVPSQLRGKAPAFSPAAQGTAPQAPIPASSYASMSSSRPTQSSSPNHPTSQMSRLSVSSQFANSAINCPPTASALGQGFGSSSSGKPRKPTPPAKTEEKKKKEEKLTFFSDEYATAVQVGTIGSAFPVRVNRLQMCANGVPALRQYRIAFPPLNDREVTNKRIKKLMIGKTLQAIGVHKNVLVSTDWNDLLITRQQDLTALANDQLKPHPLGDGTYVVTIDFPGQTQRPIVNIRPELSALNKGEFDEYLRGNRPANFNYGPYTTALNILSRHYAAQNALCIGSNRIFPLDPSADQQNGLGPVGMHPRLGFYFSVRPSNSVQLQLNPSASAFFDPLDLVEFFRRYRGRNPWSPDNPNLSLLREAQTATQKLQVRCKWRPRDSKTEPNQRWPIMQGDEIATQGRLKRICGYGEDADTQMFNDDSTKPPTKWSVRKYFEQRVLLSGIRLTYPKLPVVNVGTYDKPIWVPMELLRIEPNQNLRSPLRSTEMDAMAGFSRRRPLENVSCIETDGLRLLEHGNLDQRRIVQINPTLLQVKGRRLKAQPLVYKKGETSGGDLQKMANGKWDLIEKHFCQSANLPFLLAIQIGKFTVYAEDLQPLADSLTEYGIPTGGNGRRSCYIANAATTSFDDLDAAYEELAAPDVRTVLIILNSDKVDPYAQVKSWGEIHAGVNTICLTPKKIRSLTSGAFQANLAMKFNVKVGNKSSVDDPILGGKNQLMGGNTPRLLQPQNGLTMVVGADVTHPGPGSVPFCPSIAAVVASTDRDCARFPGSMRLQASRQEDIEGMQEMMRERLMVWWLQNKKLPSRILFYRDGVSEDQFALVKQNELRKIRAACDSAAADYNVLDYQPKITLVVCTKRHYTRFFPPKKTTANDNQHINLKDMNFKPGLVVDDRSIRLPKYFDFWLQAHAALQGTARPCHYFVLENGMNLSPNDLQQLTFALSFIYATSLTPVSLVAPAYYADKICARGRHYIRPLLQGHLDRKRDIDRLLSKLSRDTAAEEEPRKPTEEEKNDVVRNYAINQGFWPNLGRNPCHVEVKDTMFYI